MAFTKTSGAGMTSAGKTASVDIPKPRNLDHFVGSSGFTAMAAGSLPVGKHPHMLPTPPNSISPVLAPHCFRSREHGGTGGASAPLPSELDLRDSDNATRDGLHSLLSPRDLTVKAQDSGSPDFGAAGVITPALLARHHLPGILLAHGPLAIRHVMGYLTTSVPGFSRIPPPKARRLVVRALEGKGELGKGGLNGEVLFEKVGWGRWDARFRGQPPREQQSLQDPSTSGASYSPPPSLPSSHSNYPGVDHNLPGAGRWAHTSKRGTSWTDDSVIFSVDEDMEMMQPEDDSMLDHEADEMSLDNDNDRSCSSSEAPPEGPPSDEELDDLTDDEDWANIGAAALRQASLSGKGGGQRYLSSYGNPRKRLRPVPSVLPKILPSAGAVYYPHDSHEQLSVSYGTGVDIGSNSQEREAIEALVRLSSV